MAFLDFCLKNLDKMNSLFHNGFIQNFHHFLGLTAPVKAGMVVGVLLLAVLLLAFVLIKLNFLSRRQFKVNMVSLKIWLSQSFYNESFRMNPKRKKHAVK